MCNVIHQQQFQEYNGSYEAGDNDMGVSRQRGTQEKYYIPATNGTLYSVTNRALLSKTDIMEIYDQLGLAPATQKENSYTQSSTEGLVEHQPL